MPRLMMEDVRTKGAVLRGPDGPGIKMCRPLAQPLDESPKRPDIADPIHRQKLIVPRHGECKIDPDDGRPIVEANNVIDDVGPAPIAAARWLHEPAIVISGFSYGNLNAGLSG